ncbi:MAG: GntR family transcriptional regulator [Chthoniobacteraceae bacterium]|nr:GntR family transcriptional regulator [Chthoniobacteraceae bacterium]
MLPFSIKLQPGQPIYEQIVHAVKRAAAAGRIVPGDRFLSVRALSQELGINPNTVQKAVSELTAQGVLEIHPGQGCFVRGKSVPSKEAQLEALRPLIECLLVEAAHCGVSEARLLQLIQTEKRKLDEPRH